MGSEESPVLASCGECAGLLQLRHVSPLVGRCSSRGCNVAGELVLQDQHLRAPRVILVRLKVGAVHDWHSDMVVTGVSLVYYKKGWTCANLNLFSVGGKAPAPRRSLNREAILRKRTFRTPRSQVLLSEAGTVASTVRQIGRKKLKVAHVQPFL